MHGIANRYLYATKKFIYFKDLINSLKYEGKNFYFTEVDAQ
jgi:hypothetical protein